MTSDEVKDFADAAAALIAAVRDADPATRRALIAQISRAATEAGLDSETAGALAHLINVQTTEAQ
jgi:hypothetical protein